MNNREPIRATNSSTRHVFEAMRVIARSEVPLGLPEIADGVGLPPSTAHRALMTLEESGFVSRTRQSARFIPGAMLHHLIRSMVAQFPIRAAAAGTMRRISTDFDVTTSLNWRLGWSSIRLASFEGTHEAFQLRRIGELRPLHDGIGPSAILLSSPTADRDRYLQLCRSGEIHGNAPFRSERFESFARQMSEQSYLELPPSDKLGLYWISIPIHRFDGTAGGSFSVGFSMSQRTGANLAADIEHVRELVRQLQDSLDASSDSTRIYFDSLDPDEFGAESSPSHAPVKL